MDHNSKLRGWIRVLGQILPKLRIWPELLASIFKMAFVIISVAM